MSTSNTELNSNSILLKVQYYNLDKQTVNYYHYRYYYYYYRKTHTFCFIQKTPCNAMMRTILRNVV